jgi:hypothetical protein
LHDAKQFYNVYSTLRGVVLKYGYKDHQLINFQNNYPRTHEMLAKLREQSLCLVVGHARVDDNIFTLLPVNGGSDAMFVASLESYFAKRLTLKSS